MMMASISLGLAELSPEGELLEQPTAKIRNRERTRNVLLMACGSLSEVGNQKHLPFPILEQRIYLERFTLGTFTSATSQGGGYP